MNNIQDEIHRGPLADQEALYEQALEEWEQQNETREG